MSRTIKNKNQFRPGLDPLGDRCLLSAGVPTPLTNGVLSSTGTNFVVPIQVNGWTGLGISKPVTQPSVTQPPVTPSPTNGTLSAVERAIVDLTNQERQKAGLPLLVVNARLVQAAQIHAADMARLDQLGHTLPGASLPTLEDRLQSVGYSYSRAGENIAYNYPGASAVVAGWMNSPGHRANILNPDYTEIGVGVALNSRGQSYYCQDFGRPR